jgi:hypothetical protein
MDAEVFWQDRRVGILRGVRVDQPYYLGEWIPDEDPEFAMELADRRWLSVEFRSRDGAVRAPARVLISRTPGVGVYFRFG